jgi:hypothetical protein
LLLDVRLGPNIVSIKMGVESSHFSKSIVFYDWCNREHSLVPLVFEARKDMVEPSGLIRFEILSPNL